jgi:hypothetical protein
MFSFDDIDAPVTPRATLSLFPRESDVAVVFSSTQTDAPFVDAYLQRLLISEPYYQKYLLSKIILQFCENFIIDPQYYNSISQEKKIAIDQFYLDTMISNNDDYENEQLFLF